VNGGEVKRGAAGAQIDDIGAPMIVTFNQNGQFNLSDYGQPTESNIAPKLHIDWTNPTFIGASMDIDLKLGKGKGATPTAWTEIPETAEGNLTAYDGNSRMVRGYREI
jgi:hypothetical protein